MHNHSQLLTEQRRTSPVIGLHTAAGLAARGIRAMVAFSLICTAMFWASVAYAQQVPAGQAESRPQLLGWDIPMRWVEDVHENLTPDEVLSKPPSELAWLPLNHGLNVGYYKDVVWLTFDVPGASTPGDPVWLLANPTYLDSVQVFHRDAANGAWHVQHSGDYVPARLKAGIRQHLFRLQPGTVALVRVQTSSAMQFQGTVFPSTQALIAEVASGERSMGLYLGVMAALLLGIWAASVIFRTYNLYALALLGTVSTLHVFNVRGYLGMWIPDAWTIWASHAVGIGAFAVAATVAWQMREQLTRNTRYRKADRAFLVLIAVNVLGTISVPLGFYSSVAWINLVSLVVSDIIAATLCIRALLMRHRRLQHWLLLTAYGVHLVGGIPTTAVMTGLVHWNIDVTSLWQFQVLVFTALIASAVFMGMVLRYRQAEKSKDQAIEHLAQSEHELEDRIEQRTRELSLAQVWLKQALDSERDLRHEQRQFFHMISHEFRTPLTVVDSAAAEQQSFPSPNLQEQTDRAIQIRRACRRLTSLVDSCLISERLDSAGFTLHPTPTSVASLLEHAAQLVRWSPRHQLYLFTESAPTEWVCDPTLVRIALSNIVDNAVKYAASGQIFIAAQKNEQGMLEVSVADEGSGMSMEVMGRIFQQFERGDRTDQTKGFGLGLWVARRVARLHGGDIAVESQPDQGACFTLTLAPLRMGSGGSRPLADTSSEPPEQAG